MARVRQPSKPQFRYSPSPVLQPQVGCDWADQMVLNPAFIQDPESPRLHMLFRASGPWPRKRRPGCPLPYPIFLGYATSDDQGKSWNADFSRPALAPAIEETVEKLYVINPDGKKVLNYSNGCIEDPRLFYLEGQLYLTVACRPFPPGPYWEGTRLDCCSPAWATEGKHSLGCGITYNDTVSVLYQVDLAKLKAREYEQAFRYVTNLTDGDRGDNRDVFLFPRKVKVGGKLRYLLLHRPYRPGPYPDGQGLEHPSMYLAAADRIEDLATARAKHHLLAVPTFAWEQDRVGASWPPIELSDGQWLLPYHGKAEGGVGYTQSFMILEETADGWPVIRHRCSERLMYAQQPWELSGKFPTPCLFTCAGVRIGENLVMSYGAADTKAGIAWVNFEELVAYVRCFDAQGKKTSSSGQARRRKAAIR